MRRLVLLALGLLTGCSPSDQPVTITFAAVSGDQPARCTAGAPQLTDLRFYIHDVALIGTDGRAVAVALDAAPPWQNRREQR